MWKVCFTSRKLDWKSISVVAVVGRMFYILPDHIIQLIKKNQWEERLKGWEKVKWKYVFQVGRIWDIFFGENDFEWLMNVKWKILMGLWHKKIMAFCQIEINHGPQIAFYVLPFSVKKSYKFSCCHFFFSTYVKPICWLVESCLYRTHFFSRCSTLLLENY